MMVNVVGSKQDNSILKPDKLKDHFTMIEMLRELERRGVGRSRDRIIQLEKERRIPNPIRAKVGSIRIRLYSLKEVNAIENHFRNAKPGRRPK
jgi:hypothetical protein